MTIDQGLRILKVLRAEGPLAKRNLRHIKGLGLLDLFPRLIQR